LSLQFALDVAALFSVYAIVVLSLNLEAGYTGVPNFGKMLGVAVGAFTVSSLSPRLAVAVHNAVHKESPILVSNYQLENARVVFELNAWLSSSPLASLLLLVLTLALAVALGALAGYVASYPAIRLRGDYLAITLLAMAEAVRVIGYNYPPIAGGTLGVQVPDPFAFAKGSRYVVATVTLAAFAAAVYLLYERLLNSPFGRVLRAVRDDELAAEAYGKDVAAYRKRALVVGTATASLAGALYAFYVGGVIATAYSRSSWTFWPWVMMMLGGMGNNLGALAGAFAFTLVRYSIIRYKALLESYLPFSVVWLDYLLLGSALLAILAARPQGILPEKPVKTFNAKRYKK